MTLAQPGWNVQPSPSSADGAAYHNSYASAGQADSQSAPQGQHPSLPGYSQYVNSYGQTQPQYGGQQQTQGLSSSYYNTDPIVPQHLQPQNDHTQASIQAPQIQPHYEYAAASAELRPQLPAEPALGNFSITAKHIHLRGDTALRAMCFKANGELIKTKIDLNEVLANNNGQFVWRDGGGGFKHTAKHIRLTEHGRVLTADLKDMHGKWCSAKICLDEKITNHDGNLCLM